MNILRKTLIAGVALATLGASVAATTAPAAAKPFGFGHGFGFHHGFFHHGYGYGFIGAGALLGAAATTPYWGSDYGCYITRQPIVDYYGNVIGVRPVRVCD